MRISNLVLVLYRPRCYVVAMCMILVSVHYFIFQDNAPSNTILKSLFTYSASAKVGIFGGGGGGEG